MALTVGVNSYVTVAEADAYMASRYGYNAAWSVLDETAKESALISATASLDLMCDWYGSKTDPEQDLAFPRNGDTEVPDAIKNAECEIAQTMVVAGSANVTPDDVLTELTAGSATLKWKGVGGKTGGLANEFTRAYLAPYGQCHYLAGGARIVDVARAT